jgi:hypothetical protein
VRTPSAAITEFHSPTGPKPAIALFMSAFERQVQIGGILQWVESEPWFHLPIQAMGTTASFFEPASSCFEE